jgi:hypothetical protein
MQTFLNTMRNIGAFLKQHYLKLGSFITVFLFIYITWLSSTPDQKSINEIIAEQNITNAKDIVGEATTATILFTMTTLLDKNAGYTTNDITTSLGLMDNMPNWERGVLFQVRDALVVMAKDLSRSQSQSLENKSLNEARAKAHYDNNTWLYFIRTEAQYRKSISYLEQYLADIIDPSNSRSQFYARSDNLREWLEYMSKQLGSLSNRLEASVVKERINTDLANDPNAQQSTSTSSRVKVKTPWLQLDDVFWEARGTTWALLHYMKAIRVDFESILKKKNALASVDQIIHLLEATQDTIWAPMIFNGGGFGYVANHSLTMASYISSANAAMIDLRNLMEQG